MVRLFYQHAVRPADRHRHVRLSRELIDAVPEGWAAPRITESSENRLSSFLSSQLSLCRELLRRDPAGVST